MNIGKALEEELEIKIFEGIRKNLTFDLLNLRLLDKQSETITSVRITNILHRKMTIPLTRETNIDYEYR